MIDRILMWTTPTVCLISYHAIVTRLYFSLRPLLEECLLKSCWSPVVLVASDSLLLCFSLRCRETLQGLRHHEKSGEKRATGGRRKGISWRHIDYQADGCEQWWISQQRSARSAWYWKKNWHIVWVHSIFGNNFTPHVSASRFIPWICPFSLSPSMSIRLTVFFPYTFPVDGYTMNTQTIS